MGRRKIDPEILKQNQKEARRRWKENNKELNNEINLRCMRKRYNENPEYRQKCILKSKEQYLYNKETSLLRNMVC